MLIVDRIEGKTALCETAERRLLAVPLSSLPAEIREGDVLEQTPEGFRIDPAKTDARRRKTASRLRRIFETEEEKICKK